MAGDRQGAGPGGSTKPRRKDNRKRVHRERVNAAPTGEQQIALAFNHLRSVLYRHPRRAELLHRYATEIETAARDQEAEL